MEMNGTHALIMCVSVEVGADGKPHVIQSQMCALPRARRQKQRTMYRYSGLLFVCSTDCRQPRVSLGTLQVFPHTHTALTANPPMSHGLRGWRWR